MFSLQIIIFYFQELKPAMKIIIFMSLDYSISRLLKFRLGISGTLFFRFYFLPFKNSDCYEHCNFLSEWILTTGVWPVHFHHPTLSCLHVGMETGKQQKNHNHNITSPRLQGKRKMENRKNAGVWEEDKRNRKESK